MTDLLLIFIFLLLCSWRTSTSFNCSSAICVSPLTNLLQVILGSLLPCTSKPKDKAAENLDPTGDSDHRRVTPSAVVPSQNLNPIGVWPSISWMDVTKLLTSSGAWMTTSTEAGRAQIFHYCWMRASWLNALTFLPDIGCLYVNTCGKSKFCLI